jgi:hypothetical protein
MGYEASAAAAAAWRLKLQFFMTSTGPAALHDRPGDRSMGGPGCPAMDPHLHKPKLPSNCGSPGPGSSGEGEITLVSGGASLDG